MTALALPPAKSENGFTLVEVLIVSVLLVVVIGALMVPLVAAQRQQFKNANYAYSQQEARTGLDSMVSQIRQAWSIASADPNAIDMNVNLNGVAKRVYYECDIPQPGSSVYRECLRVEAPAGSALPALSTGTPVIQNILNGTTTDPVFSFGPDPIAPYYMTARVRIPASGGTNNGLNHSVVLSSGALMRNENVGN
jgi:prepilin-type N-terminal cleavage/methylation domain-containing protein